MRLSYAIVLACGFATLFACGDAGSSSVLRHNAAQSDVDPTEVAPEEAPTSSNGSEPSSGDGATAPGSDGGTPSDAGGGADASNPNDPFNGAPAFVAKTARSSHNAGKNCFSSCHNHGFTFAGTVYDAAGNGVAGAEVRLVDATGKAILVNTGPNGNFHTSTAFTAPARVGVRTASAKSAMAAALATTTSGACNSCHANGGTTKPIHVP